MRRIVLFLILLAWLPGAQAAADRAREQRWAEEILPAILDGDPIRLTQADGHQYLGLYLAPAQPRAALIQVHGMGVHPDWGINGIMRTHLAQRGYATLSIQMPVQGAEAGPGDYLETFPEAIERLRSAVAWLQAQGFSRIAIVSHSLGGRMVRAYLEATPNAPVEAWAALSLGFDDYAGLNLPILDLYTELDHPPVLRLADARRKTLRLPASEQQRIAGTGHFYEDKEAEVLDRVSAWLSKTLP